MALREKDRNGRWRSRKKTKIEDIVLNHSNPQGGKRRKKKKRKKSVKAIGTKPNSKKKKKAKVVGGPKWLEKRDPPNKVSGEKNHGTPGQEFGEEHRKESAGGGRNHDGTRRSSIQRTSKTSVQRVSSILGRKKGEKKSTKLRNRGENSLTLGPTRREEVGKGMDAGKDRKGVFFLGGGGGQKGEKETRKDLGGRGKRGGRKKRGRAGPTSFVVYWGGGGEKTSDNVGEGG